MAASGVQVRMKWALPLRILMFVGQGLLFTRMGKACPWVQSTLLHMCCIAVQMAMDRRLRSLYAKRQLSAAQACRGAHAGAAAPCAGVTAGAVAAKARSD